MKRNKFMEFLNSKGQYTAIFAFIVVAGICAGAAAYNRGVSETAEEEQTENSEPVLTNRNAEPATESNIEQETAAPKTTSEINTESAEPKSTETVPENTDNDSAWLDEDEEDFEIALTWPVEGDILMGYSPDKLVYDAILDQYRTNNSVYIAAEAGTAVKSAADGVVAEISEDDILGNYVVVEHKNGWKTTYSQLTDIEVAVGGTVSQGDTIGAVAEPSIYSSAMGSHIEFTVTLDDMTVDPEIAIG